MLLVLCFVAGVHLIFMTVLLTQSDIWRDGRTPSRTSRSQWKHSRTYQHARNALSSLWRGKGHKKQFNLILWSNDFHIAPIRDVKHFLKRFGVKIIDKSLSGHCYLTKTCQTDLRVINQRNGIRLPGDVIQKFYQAYKDDSEMSQVDGFICFHPAGMCELFMPFNKSLIVISTTRYELGRTNPNRWREWNENLKKICSDPKNFIGANNFYDVQYIRHFTGITPELVPSYCGYVTNETYIPDRKEFLLATVKPIPLQDEFLANLTGAIKMLGVQLEVYPIRSLYGRYRFSDLVHHPGIIFLPYQVSLMSLFEQYRMNIPVFFPTLELLSKWHLERNVVNERTWKSVYGRIDDRSDIEGVIDEPDPNNDKNLEAIKYWLNYSDFYQWPHITYYSSIEDLVDKLATVNSLDISSKMKRYNEKLEVKLTKQWTQILERVELGKKHGAIEDL